MNKITIFGRTSCIYCFRAVQLCETNELEYRFIDMQREGLTKADIEKTIGKPVLTVPQIFVGKEHIGGFSEFSEHLRLEHITD